MIMKGPADPKEYVAWMYKNFSPPYDKPVNDKGERVETFVEDHISLIEIIRTYGIRTIMEFGTSRGYTSLLMSYYPTVLRVKTIDPWNLIGNGEECAKNPIITFKKEASFQLDVAQEYRQHEMIFIDGDHRPPAVIADTQIAYALQPRIIAWHDFGELPGKEEQWPGVRKAAEFFTDNFHWEPKRKPLIIGYAETGF